MSSTVIGSDDPNANKISGIDDEVRDGEDNGGKSVLDDDPGHKPSREDIESGNDQNTSADALQRSPTTNRLHDDGIELGK